MRSIRVENHTKPQLRQWRELRGWSQLEAAERLQVRQGTLSKWENGQCGLSLKNLDHIANTYRLRTAELLFSDPKNQQDMGA